MAPALLDAGPHLGHALLGHGVWFLHGLERARGLLGGGRGSPGPLCWAAGPELGVAPHLLWCPPNGLGPGGPPAHRRGGHCHGSGLAPGEPVGRAPAVPVPGLAGLRGYAQLLRVAGQPRPAQWPAVPRLRVPPAEHCGHCLPPTRSRRWWPPGSHGHWACWSSWISAGSHQQLVPSGLSPLPRKGPKAAPLHFLPCRKHACET
ncbi:translocator protein isoform X1 [Choloepus didactylus]|uniref:translocator protein isoform X1 n=1 Tax=Choloepus didactylus TaxID=27675 RepID=UPI0018A05624|nr:translocator protein isoform X1 [Choloepus didactylus]